MGTAYSYVFGEPAPIKLCDDHVDGKSFIVLITIHNERTDPPVGMPNYATLLDHLQKTNPTYSYGYCKTLYLLYRPDHNPALRSNISGEIISSMAADVARFCLKNNICDPYYVEVSLTVATHDTNVRFLKSEILAHRFSGYVHGAHGLSEDTIDLYIR
jgi:hypothetical protein